MDWILLISLIVTMIALILAIAFLIFVVGHNYVLLYDLGIKAGLIRDDEENENEN